MKTSISSLLSMPGCMLFVACSEGYVSQDNTGFAETIADSNVQVADVRTLEEYAAGHIPGAANIDVKSEESDTKAAEPDKDMTVAVYCRSGARSKVAGPWAETYEN